MNTAQYDPLYGDSRPLTYFRAQTLHAMAVAESVKAGTEAERCREMGYGYAAATRRHNESWQRILLCHANLIAAASVPAKES